MKNQNMNKRSRLSVLVIALAMLAVLACTFTVAVSADDYDALPTSIDVKYEDLTIGLSQDANGIYNKVYDGTTDVSVTLNKTNAELGIAAGDDVTVVVEAAFSGKDVSAKYIEVNLALTGADANKYALKSSKFTFGAEILPKKLTWETTSVSVSVPYQPDSVEYSVPFALPKIEGLLEADKDVVPAGVVALQAKDADATKPYVLQVPVSFGDNYIVDDLTVSVTVTPITIESIEWAESYAFPFGSEEAMALDIFGVDAAGNKYLLNVIYPEGYAVKVGEYQIRVDVMNSNFVFAKAVDVTINTVSITMVEYQVSMNSSTFIGDLDTATNPTTYMLAVIGELPQSVRSLIVYTVDGKEFKGTNAYGTYNVVATLPTFIGTTFVDANGNAVTELRATLTINRASVNAGGIDEEYAVIVGGKEGVPASLTASASIPEIARKAIKSFPNYKAYTVTVSGAGEAAYTIKIAIHNDLINNGVLPTIDDLYLYDPIQGTMVKANGDGRKVMLSQGYYEISGLSGDGEWIFVLAPAHTTGFWGSALGILIIVLLVLALLALFFFVGMIQRRNRAAEALLADAEEEEEASEEEATLEETAEEMAEELAETVEPEAETEVEVTPEEVETAAEETLEEVNDQIREEIAAEEHTVAEELAEQVAEEVAAEVALKEPAAEVAEEVVEETAKEVAEEVAKEEPKAEPETVVASAAEEAPKEEPAEKEESEKKTEKVIVAAAEEAPKAEPAKKEEAPKKEKAVETVVVVAAEQVAEEEEDDNDDDEDDDAEEGFGGFNLSGLDFIDINEDPEGYAALLEREKKGEIQVVYRYRRSYQSRLAQSQGRVQDYYSVIKNALLSYKGVKGRISWNYEAFNKGRNHLAKLNAKTKTLYLYLALDPAELADTKYGIEDVSSKKKYASVPVLLKIKGDRKFKYALELIDKMCAEKMELPKRANAEDVDYRSNFKTTEELVEAGIVKKLAAGVPVESAD